MYTTLERAGEFFSARIEKELWESLPTATQSAMLTTASDLLDAYALSVGAWRKDYRVDTPRDIEIACCLVAIKLSDLEAKARHEMQEQGVSQVSIGDVSESYFNRSQDGTAGLFGISALVKSYLNNYIKPKAHTARLV